MESIKEESDDDKSDLIGSFSPDAAQHLVTSSVLGVDSLNANRR